MRNSLLVASLLWLLPAAGARGDFISWGYTWTADTPVLFSDTIGQGYVTLSSEALPLVRGTTDIVATNIRTFSTLSGQNAANTAYFTNTPYSLTLTLNDHDSGDTGQLVFTGTFSGSLSRYSSNLSHTPTGATTMSVQLGANLYTVTLGAFTPPGPPGSSNAGSLSARALVDVSPIATPEPSTLALACLGLPALGYAAMRRRRGAAKG